MISRQEAEEIATVWARRDSLRLGRPCTPVVHEFDLGYLITSTVPPTMTTTPGDLPHAVVDKETGEVSNWPRLPAPVVERLYREDRTARPVFPRTVDPAEQLLRSVRRAATPGTAAHLTVEGRLHIANGAKGEVELRHHPLVRAYLDELPPGRLVRGGERHAELIVVSDALHAEDQQRAADGQPPADMVDVVGLFEEARLEIFRIREPGDPAGGRAERPCDSCLNALVHFGLLPWSELAFTREWRPDPQPSPQPGRFPPEVSNALVAAGWQPDSFTDEVYAHAAIRRANEVLPTLTPFPAAELALTKFPGLAGGRRGPGEEVWISRFDIRPASAAHSADTLADFGRLLGVRLFPIGSEQQESILAVDEHGRVFALDQAGEWFLGADIDAALTTLLLGRAPARVRDDGTW
ncbi:SUKH-3 domain-containing protein [Micromonospora sp. CPCC 206060]|uniref:SUKH-3 domain-containing protein n=1 Tax=Micromonospora sp. CPCC 206060 TaxID=3122406 RepID=UPI002FF42651